MKELCPRLLEPKRPHIEGKPEFSIYNACKRMMELGGLGFYECHDCQVVFRRKAQDERPLPFPTKGK
jgi:hypothetical protein